MEIFPHQHPSEWNSSVLESLFHAAHNLLYPHWCPLQDQDFLGISDRLSAVLSSPFSPQYLASSSYSSLFLMVILSEQQLTQSGLQSLLLYWLGGKLNIFLCTLLLNKDLHRSALCAFVSLHTPCLFSVQTGGSWLTDSHLPNFVVSSLFWRERGICCVLCCNQNFSQTLFQLRRRGDK